MEVIRKLYIGEVREKLEIEVVRSTRIEVVYVGRGQEKIELEYKLKIKKPKVKAELAVVGVLKDRAEKNLKMEIEFMRGCVLAEAKEYEEVIILSDEVRATTQPIVRSQEWQAEGWHGVSVGKIDEKALRKLRMMGLGEAEAKKMLIRAKIRKRVELDGAAMAKLENMI